MDTNSYSLKKKKHPRKLIKDRSQEFGKHDYDNDHEYFSLVKKKVQKNLWVSKMEFLQKNIIV